MLINLIFRSITASIFSKLGTKSAVSADDSSSLSVEAEGSFAIRKLKVYLFDKGTMSFESRVVTVT